MHGMNPPSPRRGPRRLRGTAGAPAPAPPRPPSNAFRGVLIAGAVLIAGVIVVALATGTADQLPWGAMIGVVVIMAAAFVAGRRRARAFGDDDDA